MQVAAAISLLITAALVASGLKRLRGTTLTTAGWWSVAGCGIALTALVLELVVPAGRSGWADLCWYLAAVVLLCPGIAVLGARRPNAQVWGMFILVPLVLVLMWPAAASTRVIKAGVPLELEEPAIIGFGIVLIMGCGNYFGTRYTLPTILFVVSLMLLVAPLSATVPEVFPDRELARLLASLALCCAAGLATLRARHWNSTTVDRFDRLWIDFVDSYGLVWAKRVMDRINESAQHEKWMKHLELHGFVPTAESSSADELIRTEERIEHTFRWLLKRFVEPEWIDARIGAGSLAVEKTSHG
ncbi:MAG: hypothetical protein O3B13_06645 [Planctomycetota bacterium]|nr:hypothetical protein [Planctomycetota bacterium]